MFILLVQNCIVPAIVTLCKFYFDTLLGAKLLVKRWTGGYHLLFCTVVIKYITAMYVFILI